MVRLVKQQQYDKLLACDQLAREMEAGKVFSGFVEAPIAFPPTFKVIKGHPGLQYGMKRSPAWCDRVLVRSNLPHKAVRFEDYYCCPEIATSDHKPVAATMQLPLGEKWPGHKGAAWGYRHWVHGTAGQGFWGAGHPHCF